MARVLLLLVAACATPGYRYTFRVPELHDRLENGMKLLVLVQPSELVSVNVRYQVGSASDPPGKEGMAHLVEHLLYRLRPAGPGAPTLMEETRRQTLYFNAYTARTHTQTINVGTAETLDAVLALEAAKLTVPCESIAPEDFENVRQVVLNELRERESIATVRDAFVAELYPDGHPFARPAAGDLFSVSTITRDEACAFLARHYAPGTATMVVAGGVDTEEVRARVAARLGAIPARDVDPPEIIPPPVPAPGTVGLELPVSRPAVAIAWPLPSDRRELSAAIAGATAVFADWSPVVLGAPTAPVLVVLIDLEPRSDPQKAAETVLRRAATMGPTLVEGPRFAAARELAVARVITGLENSPRRALVFAAEEEKGSQAPYLDAMLRDVRELDGDAVGAVFRRVFVAERARIVIVKPGPGGEAALSVPLSASPEETHQLDAVEDPGELLAPAAVPRWTSRFYGLRGFTLPNGLEVALLPRESQIPRVVLRLVYRSGLAAAPWGKWPVPYLAAAASTVDRRGLYTSALLNLGAYARSVVTMDATLFEVEGLDVTLGPLLAGLERWAGPTAVAPGLATTLARLSQELPEVEPPEWQLRSVLRRAVFGAGHPYARHGEKLAALTADDVQAWRAAKLTPGNAILVVAGRFDPVEAERRIRSLFGRWKGTTPPLPLPAPPAPRAPEYWGLVDRQRPTVRVGIGYAGPAGWDDQEAARRVLAAMLSDRMEAVREQLGASYGVTGEYHPHVGPGLYEVWGELDPARAGAALKRMREVIDRLRTGKDFAGPFARARRAVLRSLLVDAGDSAQAARDLAELSIYRRGKRDWLAMAGQVASLRPEAVVRLAEAELAPEKEVVVALGNEAALQAMFEQCGVQARFEPVR